MNQEVFKSLDFSKMELALGGGMAVQDIVAQAMEKLTEVPLEAYGLSETSPAATINPWNNKHKMDPLDYLYPILTSKFLIILKK